MTIRHWIIGCLLSLTFSLVGVHCFAQSAQQLLCEKGAAAGYKYCLAHGLIHCAPQEPCGNAPPQKGSVAMCMPAYSTAYNACQPSFNWAFVGNSGNPWPPARESAASWTDNLGNHWLFGGNFFGNFLGDLWVTNTAFPNTGITWTSVPAAGPGPRTESSFATDPKGNLWMFGGNSSFRVALNELWKFDSTQKTWTLICSTTPITGSTGAVGIYGAPGAPSPVPCTANMPFTSTVLMPGGRYGAVSWFDTKGNFWLFGGDVVSGMNNNSAQPGGLLYLNDLWEFNTNTNTWTFQAGQPQIYAGQNGVAPTTSSTPGGRVGAAGWTDGQGNLWLFGGYGYDTKNNVGSLNDLWEYANAAWQKKGGASIIMNFGVAPGNSGAVAVPAITNWPAGRAQAASWTDSQRNFWMYGGTTSGFPPFLPSTSALYDDLWEFKSQSNTWIWIGGASSLGGSVAPGPRYGATVWSEGPANFWLFGGYGLLPGPNGGDSDLNDLWHGTGVVY
jgi:Kelch motif/Galactose oxidase, central domain